MQEVIVQNFRAKANTRFAAWPEPATDDVVRTAAVARLIFGTSINLQMRPNLTQNGYGSLDAGINDWGGISPVTRDFINPEMAWPENTLQATTSAAGFQLRERLAAYPEYVSWMPDPLRQRALTWVDDSGVVTPDQEAR
jgi:FO synthase